MSSKNKLFFLFIMSLLLLSSCRQANSDKEIYYYGSLAEGTTGNGNGGSCGCGCCCCGCCGHTTDNLCDTFMLVTNTDGEPVPGAIVIVNHEGSQSYLSNEDGEVLLTGLDDGSYAIKVIADGYRIKYSYFVVQNGVCPLAEIVLERNANVATCDPQITVVGKLFGPNTTPIPGVTVEINGRTYTTNDAGVPEPAITGLTANGGDGSGNYAYTISYPGYINTITGVYSLGSGNSYCGPRVLTATRPNVLVTNCDAHFSLYGTSSRGIAGSSILFNGVSYSFDTSGLVTINNLAVGTYQYSITAPGYEPVNSGSYVVSGTPPVCNPVSITAVTCQPTFTVTYATGDASAPLQGAVITINGNTYTTDARGQAVITPGLLRSQAPYNGTYSYSVTALGYQDVTGTYNVQSDKSGFCPNVGVKVTPVVSTTCNATFTFSACINSLDTPCPTATVPVEGVQMSFDGANYTSGSDGTITVSNLVNGTHTYSSITMPAGYEPITTPSGSYTVASGSCPAVPVLTRSCQPIFPIWWMNKNVGTQGPLENAKVTINGADYYTDANGNVAIIPGLLQAGGPNSNGVYAYTLSATGYRSGGGNYQVISTGGYCPVFATLHLYSL